MREAWWRRTVRSWLGPDPELAAVKSRAIAQVSAAHTERDQARRDAENSDKVARSMSSRHDTLAARLLVLMNEPPGVEGCSKIRLRDRDEAQTLIGMLAAEVDRNPDEFEVYACKVCPRHPVHSTRYLHIANRDPNERTGRGGTASYDGRARAWGKARRDGRQLSQRIDHKTRERLEALREATGEAG